jgi:hypothetical protein
MPTGALLYLPRGDAKFKVNPNGHGPVGDFAYLHDGPNGSVWLSDELGLRRVSGNGSTKPASRGAPTHPRFGNFTFDSGGTLWAASSNGIQRFPDASEMSIGVSVDPAAGQTFTMAQGLTTDVAWKLLMGREGTFWIGTNAGLDQLRRNVISQLPIPATNEHQFAVAVGELFARYLNTSESTIEKWETGAKQPSGMALKLLSVVEKHGLEALS